LRPSGFGGVTGCGQSRESAPVNGSPSKLADAIRPFWINIPESKLVDLRERVIAEMYISVGALAACVLLVVVIAEVLAPQMKKALVVMTAPKELVGLIVSSVVLMPEGVAAIRAARRNRLQTSLNLALGSALASIGFTIPAVAIISLFNGWTLALGLPPKQSVLLGLALLVSSLSLNTGRTRVLQGAVHLMIFMVYVFKVVVP
jgi:Ca2+:H+ antiporter